MFRWFVVSLVLLVFAPAALAQDATASPVAPWECPEGFEGQTLSVYNWTTYIAEDAIANFEAACGVTVQYTVYGTNEELLTRIRQGNPGYDVMMPSDYAVAALIGEGLLQPLDFGNIPNFANVSENLLNPPYDPDNIYSAPYQWGTIAIGYNVAKTGEITSWEQVWAYDGPVAWLNESRTMLGTALQILGLDPNSENPDDVTAARDYLAENSSNVVALADDDGQAMLERGDVDIAIEYNGDIFQVMAESEPGTFNYVIPDEGARLWVDAMVIPVDAPNKPLAEVFIDYVLHPQVGADISNYTAYGSPNEVAIDSGLILPELLDNHGIYPTDEIRANLFFVEDLPEAQQLYNDAWVELTILLGQ